MKNVKMWEVPTVSIQDTIKQKIPTGISSDDLKYTLLDTQQVAFRDTLELAELATATGITWIPELVSFQPERMAVQQAIVSISTSIKINDLAQELPQLVENVLTEAKSELDTKCNELRATRDNIQAYVRNNIQIKSTEDGPYKELYDKMYAKFDEKLSKSQANLGQYKGGYNKDEAMIALITDAIYKEVAGPEITKTIDFAINSLVTKGKINSLTPPDAAERMTYMVTGGQASGKGTSVAQMQKLAENNGIEWDNVAKVNSDAFKAILLEPGSVKPELFSQLSQDESADLSFAIFNKLEALAKAGKAPHVLVDQVNLAEGKINYGLLNNGKVSAIVVSTDVTDAMERSFTRGEKVGIKGRYENTQGILNGHKNTANAFPVALSKYIGKEVYVKLVDNNVKEGSQPDDVMAVNLKDNSATIIDEDKLTAFIKKTNINIAANSKDTVYLAGATITTEKYLAPLANKGMITKKIEPAVTDKENKQPEVAQDNTTNYKEKLQGFKDKEPDEDPTLKKNF